MTAQRWAERTLIGCVAMLLCAGAWSATTVVDADRSTVLAAGGFTAEGIAEEPSTTSTTVPAATSTTMTTGVPAPAPTTTAVTRRPSAPTTQPPATTPARTPLTLVPGLPLPTLPDPILEPPVNRWSSAGQDITARLRMEPAAPLPGQPVRFYVDVVTPQPCCAMVLSYGDGTVSPNSTGGCESPTTRTATLTHTFTVPGDYELRLAAATYPCQPSAVVDGRPSLPVIYGTSITACITVGLRLVGRPDCQPYNHFGPDSVVSAG